MTEIFTDCVSDEGYKFSRVSFSVRLLALELLHLLTFDLDFMHVYELCDLSSLGIESQCHRLGLSRMVMRSVCPQSLIEDSFSS